MKERNKKKAKGLVDNMLKNSTPHNQSLDIFLFSKVKRENRVRYLYGTEFLN